MNMSNENNTNEDSIDNDKYIAQVYQDIEDWKNPDSNLLHKTLATLTAPIDKAGDALMNAPQFGDTLKQATKKTLTTLSDAANWSLDTQDVIEAYQNDVNEVEASVKKLEDIKELPIAAVDEQVKLFKSKYVALTSAQGVTTGLAGWAGIPADIAGLLTANLRAISEYGSYYGFDMSEKGEQIFAMSLLGIATSNSSDERQAAVEEAFALVKAPETLAFNQVNEELMSRVLRQTATKVASNLVKTKAAQIIPAVGAVVASGVNASYTSSVCEAAYQGYRQRFLDRQQS